MYLVILAIGVISVSHQVYFVGHEMKTILGIYIFSITEKQQKDKLKAIKEEGN
jgi:hypothetical protein